MQLLVKGNQIKNMENSAIMVLYVGGLRGERRLKTETVIIK